MKNLINSLEKCQDKSEKQAAHYIGRVALQSFLDIINVFEQSTSKLVEKNNLISEMLNKRMDKKILLIEESRTKEVNSKTKMLECDRTKNYIRKQNEMKFISETLFINNIIKKLDTQILDFAWDVRNSMHTNYLAIKDMEFSASETGLNYSFQFKKGQALYNSADLLPFYFLAEQIIFIQLNILHYFNINNISDNKNKDI